MFRAAQTFHAMIAFLVVLAITAASVADPAPAQSSGSLWVVGVSSDSRLRGLLDEIQSIGVGLLDHEPTGRERGIVKWAHPISPTETLGEAANGADPLATSQYAIGQLDLDKAWNTSTGAGATIAILDSGLSITHPDLRTVRIHDSLANDSMWGIDTCGHGTAVAGVIAAGLHNAVGISGAAASAAIMPIKVLGDDCHGNTFDLAKGIVIAALSGADIISISIEAGAPGGAEPLELRASIAFASTRGSLVVVAAGNSGSGAVNPLSLDPDALSVACANEERGRCASSSYGPSVFLAAPGQDVLTTRSDGEYAYFTGTSLSAPYVSAVAALVKSHHPDFCTGAIKAALADSSTSLEGTSAGMGHGIVNASGALLAQPSFPCVSSLTRRGMGS